MPGFLYFLPNAKQSDVPGELSQWGLEYIRDDDAPIYSRGCMGPNGMHGVICGSGQNWQPEQVKSSLDLVWKPFPKTHAERQAWLAYPDPVRTPMPSPVDLARVKRLPGEYLLFPDGNRWLVPNARMITDSGSRCALPLSFDLDEETGEWITGNVLPPYRKIWNHANAYIEAQLKAIDEAEENETISFVIPNASDLVVDALQVNYRVSSRELASLGILATGIAAQIAEVLVDTAGLSKLKKKAVDATGNS